MSGSGQTSGTETAETQLPVRAHSASEPRVARPRIIVADDHQLVLDGLRAMLDAHYDVVECVTTSDALIRAVAAHAPDAVVCDISMPGDGFEAARTILERTPQVAVVLLTMTNSPALAARALELGVRAYVLKTEAVECLIGAIDGALAGDTHMSPALATPSPPDPADHTRTLLQHLTNRQRQVLRLLVEGHTMKVVAHKLHISPRTVAFHKYRIMEAMGVKTNAELIRVVVDAGTMG